MGCFSTLKMVQLHDPIIMIVQETQPQTNKQPRILIVAAVAFVVVSVLSAYFQISNTQLENKITALEAQKKELTSPTANQTRQGQRAKALEVKAKLDGLKAESIQWSQIANQIDRTIPKTVETLQPIVIIRTYNGNTQGRIALNAMTRPDSADPFKDVADVIASFSSNPSFKAVFVPSVTRSQTAEGNTVISFSMNMSYQKDALNPEEPTGFTLPATDNALSTATPIIPTTPVAPVQPKPKIKITN